MLVLFQKIIIIGNHSHIFKLAVSIYHVCIVYLMYLIKQVVGLEFPTLCTRSMQVFDAIVVGAGIQGCSTAYELVLRGQDTLLLEQFDRLHTRGSSHGASRITRMGYDRCHHARMMKEAFSKWSKIETDSGQEIFM
jgi:hypothetical protein